MGDVYRATDETLGRVVAVKVLAARHAHDEEIRARFVREALAAARLSHEPNTVTIYDVGEHDGRPFIVMEHIEGGSLAERTGPQRPADALPWIEQAARALDAAHREGVVHRDVKPGNLLLGRDSEVRVADFGIASAIGHDSLTQTGTVLGTAGYLAPEQARGERATPASDVYALGVVAFELLTGQRPFESDTPTSEAVAHVQAPVPSAHALRPELPPAIDGVFERVLAKDAAQRFESAETFAAALRGALAGTQPTTRVATTAARTAVAAPPRRRRSVAPLVLTALGVLALAGAGAAWMLAGDEERAAPTTVVETVTAPGTTVEQTVTADPPPAPPPPPASTQTDEVVVDGHSLNDQGFALMQQGQYEQALPLLEQAVSALEGEGPADPYEGYANFNLGVTLLELGRCEEAFGYLERSLGLQPDRSKEINKPLRAADKCIRKGESED